MGTDQGIGLLKGATYGLVDVPEVSWTGHGGRGCLIIGLIILFFPIGLLFLLIKPTYQCRSCGYRFQT
ncbi:MAG: hypothetical protein QF733_00155 [Phycisphaerales bacterium]|nr:hypothetical protein [Phycisphaerales bacterium]